MSYTEQGKLIIICIVRKYFTLLHTQVAFDALLDALGVKIERRYFLTIPKYTHRSV